MALELPDNSKFKIFEIIFINRNTLAVCLLCVFDGLQHRPFGVRLKVLLKLNSSKAREIIPQCCAFT